MASLGSEVGDGGRQKSRAEKAHTSGLAGGVSSDAHYLSVLYILYLQLLYSRSQRERLSRTDATSVTCNSYKVILIK